MTSTVSPVSSRQPSTTAWPMPGGSAIEHAVAPQQELPADGVAGEPHREVEVRVHPLDHEAAPVAEPHPFERRAGTSVVSADRYPFDGFVEDRGHRAALAPWKSARV